MDIKKTLENLGLSKNEILIYLNLLEHGSSKAGKIAKECHLDRSATYNALNNLVNKGITSYVIISKTKWFQADNPKRLLEMLNQKRDNLKEILPSLESMHKETKLKGQVTLHKGLKGVETVLQDILRNTKENLVFGSESQLEKRMPHYKEQFTRELEKRNIKSKVIKRKNSSKSKIAVNKNNLSQFKFIDTKTESPVVTNIYEDKIAIIIWTKEPESILIENKEAADSYREYFKFMWNNAKQKIK